MTTFGDSTKTPGQFVADRYYILAQLPSDANIDWARDLRIALGKDELKFANYLADRFRVQAKTRLWKRVLEGTKEATVVVVENNFYIQAIYFSLTEEGAEFGHDFALEDLLKRASLLMIRLSPALDFTDPMQFEIPYMLPTTTRPSPDSVLKQIGGKFNDAVVFSARAEASTCDEDQGEFHGPIAKRRRKALRMLSLTERVFDEEHPRSAEVLNQLLTADNIYDIMSDNAFRPAMISEAPSHSNDFLQAADFCAGFASEIMMNEANDKERALRQHFRRVIFNGRAK